MANILSDKDKHIEEQRRSFEKINIKLISEDIHEFIFSKPIKESEMSFKGIEKRMFEVASNIVEIKQFLSSLTETEPPRDLFDFMFLIFNNLPKQIQKKYFCNLYNGIVCTEVLENIFDLWYNYYRSGTNSLGDEYNSTPKREKEMALYFSRLTEIAIRKKCISKEVPNFSAISTIRYDFENIHKYTVEPNMFFMMSLAQILRNLGEAEKMQKT